VIDITSWGSDLPGRPRLGNLVRQILDAVQDLPRLRLSSIDPAEPDAELMDVFAEDERLLPHLHLSLQHGDDLILKRMKRRHLRVIFCAFVMRRVAAGRMWFSGLMSSLDSQPKLIRHIKPIWRSSRKQISRIFIYFPIHRAREHPLLICRKHPPW
jgi:hypothetical protein